MRLGAVLGPSWGHLGAILGQMYKEVFNKMFIFHRFYNVFVKIDLFENERVSKPILERFGSPKGPPKAPQNEPKWHQKRHDFLIDFGVDFW